MWTFTFVPVEILLIVHEIQIIIVSSIGQSRFRTRIFLGTTSSVHLYFSYFLYFSKIMIYSRFFLEELRKEEEYILWNLFCLCRNISWFHCFFLEYLLSLSSMLCECLFRRHSQRVEWLSWGTLVLGTDKPLIRDLIAAVCLKAVWLSIWYIYIGNPAILERAQVWRNKPGFQFQLWYSLCLFYRWEKLWRKKLNNSAEGT